MHLATYAAKYNAEVCDWSATVDKDAADRGWQFLAVFSDVDDCEPDMMLVKSPRWPGYQVRDIASGITSGTMLTEPQVKRWLKSRAVSNNAGGQH